MGWQLSRKGDQYRIWSTISDQYITDWISREEAIAVWYDDALMQFKKKVIEQYLKFPYQWGDREIKTYGAVIEDDKGRQQLLDWMKQLSNTHDENEYCKIVDETFEKIKIELGGKLNGE